MNAGTYVWSKPLELQFGCVVNQFDFEEEWADRLTEGSPASRVVAARVLWDGHSRLHSRTVLQLLADLPAVVPAAADLRRAVETRLEPHTILRELLDGDYRWGAWLGFLRPHPDLVPALLAGLTEQPEYLHETVLALGGSGDGRALEPLLALVASDDYRTAGDAAQALGYLGLPEAEPALIEALPRDNNWLQVKACGALERIGTGRAVPALELLAADEGYTGALNVRGRAKDALESIARRAEG
ncbi:MAG: repeat protein [Gemmataceae bacterium]|nr:repeat protein [Gemmataceae bacterium]